MIGAVVFRAFNPGRLGRAAALALAIVVAALASGAASVASAQTAGSASLTAVTVTDGPAGEIRVLLAFNQILPQFSIVTNDVDHPLLGFANTVRGPGARAAPPAHGLLKSIEFNQRDTVLTVTLVGTAPIHVAAKPAQGGNALVLTLTAAASGVVRQGGPSLALSGPLPQYADRGSGEDGFEVVPLKYADISEIVGLLSSGPAIRPNDTFTPQEPAFGSTGITGNANNNNLVAPAYNPNNQDAAATAYGQLIDDSIGVDRRLNAIILRGPPERIARLKEKIAALDVPVQSVILETVFVELTETGAHDVGLDFNNANGQI
ncbi:MAG: hypothetical protein ABI242_12760, partial [Caulobacteraceae bacterium]